jgi:hypothetical protein
MSEDILILSAKFGGGSGTSIVDKTYAELVTAIGGSTLTKGQLYRITD